MLAPSEAVAERTGAWFPVISADTHIREPRDLYQERLPGHLRHRGPRIESLPEGDRLLMGGRFLRWVGQEAQLTVPASERNWKGTRYEIGRCGQFDPEARKYDMACDDVQGEIIYGFTFWMDDPDREIVYEMIRIYNDWAAEAFADVADRTVCVPMLPSWDPDLSLIELSRVRETLGHRAVQIAAPYTGDFKYGYANRAYEPLWAACVDLDVPIAVHIASGMPHARYTGPGATIHDYMDCFLDSADIVRDFIGSGIFDRHPALHLVATEGGIGWAPWYLMMMDRMHEEFGEYFYPKLKERPGTYFRRNCTITWQDDEPGVRCIDLLGDAVAWGSDYPHAEGTFPGSRAAISGQIGHLPVNRQEALCGANAARVFGFDLELLASKYGPGSAHHQRYSVRDGGTVSADMLEPVVPVPV